MQKVPKQNLHKIVIYETSQDQQQETAHRALQAKDETILTVTSTTVPSARYVYVSTNSNARNMYQHTNWASNNYLT